MKILFPQSVQLVMLTELRGPATGTQYVSTLGTQKNYFLSFIYSIEIQKTKVAGRIVFKKKYFDWSEKFC